MTDKVYSDILKLVKQNLRIVFNDEDDILKTMIQSADRTVRHAVGTQESFFVDNPSYVLAILKLTANDYLNRSATTDVNLYKTPTGYNDLILEMKADYMVWEQNNGTITEVR